MNKAELLEEVLSIDEDLKNAYLIGHNFIRALDKITFKKSVEFLKATISNFQASGIKQFLDVAGTFANWKTEIINSFIITPDGFSLTNGPIEGMNNKVKTIKKLSYGVTNFNHLRLRILIAFDK